MFLLDIFPHLCFAAGWVFFVGFIFIFFVFQSPSRIFGKRLVLVVASFLSSCIVILVSLDGSPVLFYAGSFHMLLF